MCWIVVVGETILDIQCRRGFLTVCAPDGPDACPVAYSSQTNVGVCGFATLNHFLNTTNIAGQYIYEITLKLKVVVNLHILLSIIITRITI
jgi:hypothetical protein